VVIVLCISITLLSNHYSFYLLNSVLILRRLYATAITVENQIVLHSLSAFVALVIQYAVHVRHIVICGLSGPTILIFPHYLYHIRQDFLKKGLLNIKFVSIVSTNLKHLKLKEEFNEI
jgi:hypothetical protein